MKKSSASSPSSSAVREELYQEGTQIDSTTVATRLKDTDLLDKSGGMEYILNLMNAAVTSANTLTYVNLIRDKAMMRRMIEAAERVVEEGFNGQTDLNDYLDRSEKEILNVSRNRKAGEFKNPNDVLNEVLKTIRAASQNSTDITGLKTGFNDFDHPEIQVADYVSGMTDRYATRVFEDLRLPRSWGKRRYVK